MRRTSPSLTAPASPFPPLPPLPPQNYAVVVSCCLLFGCPLCRGGYRSRPPGPPDVLLFCGGFGGGTSFFLIAFSLGRRSAEPVTYPQCKPMGAAAGLLVAGIVRSSATVAPCCGGCGGRVGPQPDTGFAHRFYPLVQEGQTNAPQMWSLIQGATLTWTPALPADGSYTPGAWVLALLATNC